MASPWCHIHLKNVSLKSPGTLFCLRQPTENVCKKGDNLPPPPSHTWLHCGCLIPWIQHSCQRESLSHPSLKERDASLPQHAFGHEEKWGIPWHVVRVPGAETYPRFPTRSEKRNSDHAVSHHSAEGISRALQWERTKSTHFNAP